MTTFWGTGENPTAQQTGTSVDGDIFISSLTLMQRRKINTVSTPPGSWVFIVPPADGQPRTTTSDTRGDVLPPGGQLNDRLATVGSGRPWEVGWANAADGVVGPPIANSPTGAQGRFDQVTPAAIWQVNHNLGTAWIDVTVISPGDPGSDQPQTIIVPGVEYLNEMQCRLHFLEPVSGSAIIRR